MSNGIRVKTLPNKFKNLTEVAELLPEKRYILKMKQHLPLQMIENFIHALEERGLHDFVFVGPEFEVYEIEKNA